MGQKINYTSVYLSRLAVLVLLSLILIGGIVVRIYLDSTVKTQQNFVANSTTSIPSNLTVTMGSVLTNSSPL